MQAKVALVCDSSVCLHRDIVVELALHIVPLELSLDGKTYLDGVDISPQEVYSLLAGCEKLPTTSAPSSASFIKAFAEGAAHAESVLCLTLLSTVSATCNVALAAAQVAREARPDINIEVMDTGTAAGGQGLVVLAAARAAAQDADLLQVKHMHSE